uniref:ESAT-6 secretion machinery protein EssB n=1 Tax=Ganoderma boninense TaxID=34458 RepID=A0A5K1JSD4_9APHY|nr:ESAT-6 secretion machinery protein EssB [Ganoderma boninense]
MVWCRNGNTVAPNSTNASDSYSCRPAYPPTTYPDAEGSFGVGEMGALTGRMANACLSPEASSAGISTAAGGSGSVGTDVFHAYGPTDASPWVPNAVPHALNAEQDCDLFSYNGSSRWYEGSVDHSDEEILHVVQHVNTVERPFVPTPPLPSRTHSSTPVIEPLAQGTYASKQRVKGTPAGPVYFNKGLGVSLGSLARLRDANEPAFDTAADIGEKASIRFERGRDDRIADEILYQLLELRERYSQVRVRHGDKKGRGGSRPITMREMADVVFGELRELMEHVKKLGTPLRHRGDVIDIERVVLLHVNHISKGSLQPILGIRYSA